MYKISQNSPFFNQDLLFKFFIKSIILKPQYMISVFTHVIGNVISENCKFRRI